MCDLLFSVNTCRVFFSRRPGCRCWEKANIYSAAMYADIDAEIGRTKDTGKQDGVYELESLVSRMSVGTKGGDVDEDIADALSGLGLAPAAKPTAAAMETVDRWPSVEENEEVAEAIVA